MRITPPRPSRRAFLSGGGALIVSFASINPLVAQGTTALPGAAPLPGSLAKTSMLDSWIRIDAEGAITVFTGKAELGQGIKTALLQLAAEELVVAPKALRLVTADTALTPDEGYTAGSHSMQDSGTAIRNAAAQVRDLLIGLAAAQWQVPTAGLFVEGGAVIAADGRSISYGKLVADQNLHIQAQPQPVLVPVAKQRLIGLSLPRIDIPAKVTGGAAYVQDMRLPDMAHGRVLLPPSYGAVLRSVDISGVEHLPGLLKVVHDANYLAVIAEREYQAVTAMQALAAAAVWHENADLPEPRNLFETLAHLPGETVPVLNGSGKMPEGAQIIEAAYSRAYQMHGSIGPSCAVAQLTDGGLSVWTHTQGVFPLRAALAQLTGLPLDKVRCTHVEGSGCYGHNGADDVAADAAIMAFALPGRPVRVQWMREQEHTWEPYGSAMLTHARAALSPDHKILAWDYSVGSCTHSTRPGGAGNLVAAWLRSNPIAQPAPKPLPLPEGGGHRNAAPLYSIMDARVVYDFIPDMPLRVSAMRGLGAYMNIFSIESFMDELAHAAGADPVDFRVDHLGDIRATDVIARAAERFGWAGYFRTPGRGRGFGFARYKNLAAYLAVAVEVEVDRETGRTRLRRAVAAVDSGEVVNPDGIRNQIEGGILQSASWTLYEGVQFDRTRITSRDWSSYPIMRFSAVPDTVDVHVINRPGTPFLGTGEAAQGPTSAAIANAIFDAVGIRLRDIPLTAARVKAAIGV